MANMKNRVRQPAEMLTPKTILSLPPTALIAIADDLERSAADLRRRAAILLQQSTIRDLARETARARQTTPATKRNIQIMKLASRGWTNQQIADRFRLHPASVSRIIRNMLKEAGAAADLSRPRENPQRHAADQNDFCPGRHLLKRQINL